MQVEVLKPVRFQDGGRERELLPGQTLDIADALAERWVPQGWVQPVRVKAPAKAGGAPRS